MRPASLATVRAAIVACNDCPRLRRYCTRIAREKKAAHRDDTYWGRPVPGFGDPDARLLLVGLAPAAHGANRTGRVFTGDGVGRLPALARCTRPGSPTSRPRAAPTTASTLRDAYILAAVRCAPPDNKPTPDEIARCRPPPGRRDRRPAPRPRRRRAGQDRTRRVPGARRRDARRAAPPAPGVRARQRGRPGRRPADAARLLPPEPPEHQHRQADPADDARRVHARAARC